MGICLRNFDIACKKYDMKVKYEKTKAKKRLGKNCIYKCYNRR